MEIKISEKQQRRLAFLIKTIASYEASRELGRSAREHLAMLRAEVRCIKAGC
jgi:hypothetical protein